MITTESIMQERGAPRRRTTTSTPERAEYRQDGGRALSWMLGAVAAGAAVLVVFSLLFTQLAQVGADDDVAVQDVREGSLTVEAYEAVGLGDTKEDVVSQLRPVLPVDTRIVDRHEAREPAAVAAGIYFKRYGGRAGEQFRFCFDEDVLVDKTLLLAGDPGPGSAVINE